MGEPGGKFTKIYASEALSEIFCIEMDAFNMNLGQRRTNKIGDI
jgi:hypothetical protein